MEKPTFTWRISTISIADVYLKFGAIWAAIAVNEGGYREVWGAAEGVEEEKAGRAGFFQGVRSVGWMAKSWLLEISARECLKPWEKCCLTPNTSDAPSIDAATYSWAFSGPKGS